MTKKRKQIRLLSKEVPDFANVQEFDHWLASNMGLTSGGNNPTDGISERAESLIDIFSDSDVRNVITAGRTEIDSLYRLAIIRPLRQLANKYRTKH